MVLVGTSLGSAVAVHFARQHPEAVAKLVFAGPQVYMDGIGPMSSMPRLLSYLGVQVSLTLQSPCQPSMSRLRPFSACATDVCTSALQVLKSMPLRRLANRMAYHDSARLATEDAMRIGRLHTFMPGAASNNHIACSWW